MSGSRGPTDSALGLHKVLEKIRLPSSSDSAGDDDRYDFGSPWQTDIPSVFGMGAKCDSIDIKTHAIPADPWRDAGPDSHSSGSTHNLCAAHTRSDGTSSSGASCRSIENLLGRLGCLSTESVNDGRQPSRTARLFEVEEQENARGACEYGRIRHLQHSRLDGNHQTNNYIQNVDKVLVHDGSDDVGTIRLASDARLLTRHEARGLGDRLKPDFCGDYTFLRSSGTFGVIGQRSTEVQSKIGKPDIVEEFRSKIDWDFEPRMGYEADVNNNQALAIPDMRGRTPLRPSYGTAGDPIQVRANHFSISVPSIEIHEYTVTIEPRDLPRYLQRVIFNAMCSAQPQLFAPYSCVFDGRCTCYARAPLPLPAQPHTTSVKVADKYERRQDFQLTIAKRRTLSLGALAGVFQQGRDLRRRRRPAHLDAHRMAVDEVLRCMPSQRYTSIGDAFFEPRRDRESSLGGGKELWFGFFQAITTTERCLAVTVDVSATAFHSEIGLIDLLANIMDVSPEDLHLSRQPLPEVVRMRFYKEIKGLKIHVTHLGQMKRRYRVTNVTRRPASHQAFPFEVSPGQSVDLPVSDYFAQKYHLHLKYPHLPCVQVGNEAKHVFLPLEVCRIVKGQRCSKKLTDVQTSTMIKATAMTAPEREKEIERLVQVSGFEADPYARAFGLTVSRRMAQLEARVLHAPRIIYGAQSVQKAAAPIRGVWDMRGKRFHTGVQLRTWAVAIFASQSLCKEPEVRRYLSQLVRVAQSAGMHMQPTPVFCKYAVGVEQVEPMFNYLKDTFKDLQLILVILPGKTHVYAEVKRVGDTLVGIPTQCARTNNVLATSPQTLSNLCLKINAKLGGVNAVLQPSARPRLFNEPVVFLGATVTHPSHDETHRRPSIAAVVGSLDAHPCRYAATVRLQQHRGEQVDEMTSMVRELMVRFYKSTGFKPQRIVMYRDGVSHGQFFNVLRHELRAIREACLILEPGYEPGITYVAIQKAHHTRLFAAHEADRVGKAANVPPGTVVDTVVTHPGDFDFFLCSHAGIQGTSRPAHYLVLWDDNQLSADDLQLLTYQLCHTYVRCTRSVSIPAPAYYAHLVAYRAKYHLIQPDGTDDLPASVDTNSSQQSLSKSVQVHPNAMNQGMYFT